MSSIKECTLAFFKGLAFGKGLIKGRELAENKDMAEDRWITIHPFGWKQGEADTGEGKGYYRRIFIDDETGEIEKGLGVGTNIKDLSKTLKAKRKGEEAETTSKTVTESTGKSEKPKSLPQQIKASQRDIEAENKNKEFINKVGAEVVKDKEQEERFNQYKDKVEEYLNKYGNNPRNKAVIQKAFISKVHSGYFSSLDDVFKNLDEMPTEEAYQERKQKFDDKVQAVKDQLNELKDKLNAVDLKDRRKSKYLNEIDKNLKTVGEWAFGAEGVKICPANMDAYEEQLKTDKGIIERDLFRLANKWLRENEYMNYKISDEDQKASENLAQKRSDRVDRMYNRAEEIKKAGYERANKGWEELHEIPFGQPNIAGRGDIYKHPTNLIEGGYAEVKRGENLERRAKGAEQALNNMRSDDPAIIPKLQEAIRNTDNSAERQRLRDRLDTAIRTLERNKSGGGLNKSTKLYDVEENVTDGRIRFKFDGKPRQEIIDIMKSRGFKWSPSNKAWQRQNTPNGVWSAKKVMEELKQFE